MGMTSRSLADDHEAAIAEGTAVRLGVMVPAPYSEVTGTGDERTRDNERPGAGAAELDEL